LGGFTEEIAPGAFDSALKKSDIRGLFNHDPNYPLGRSGRTMKVWASKEGLEYDIPQLPAARADVMEAIERGDVDGNSFSFTVEADEWGTRDGRPHRTITAFRELFDVGPVTFPAYSQTTVSARAEQRALTMQEEIDVGKQDEEKRDETKALEERVAELEAANESLRRRIRLLEQA
jgi:HK97 family phage prohead protease